MTQVTTDELQRLTAAVDALLVDIEAMRSEGDGEYAFSSMDVIDMVNGTVEWPNLAIGAARLRQLLTGLGV